MFRRRSGTRERHSLDFRSQTTILCQNSMQNRVLSMQKTGLLEANQCRDRSPTRTTRFHSNKNCINRSEFILLSHQTAVQLSLARPSRTYRSHSRGQLHLIHWHRLNHPERRCVHGTNHLSSHAFRFECHPDR